MSSKPLGRNYAKLFAASTLSNLGDGVGQIAYPWLASALTRNPVLIALVAVASRLPWLVMTLPAGALADRYDRSRLMVSANSFRALLTVGVTVMVFTRRDSLPSPDQLDAGFLVDTDITAYIVLLVATLLLGCGEVIYDNAAQTIMPSLVDTDQLEKANGRLWSAEQVGNTAVGPILGSLLLAISFSIPFGFDAATFAIAAIFIATLPKQPRPKQTGATEAPNMRAEIAEGLRWLWNHEFLRHLAIILGLFNMLGAIGGATLVLFAQEVLALSPTEFALLGTGGAVGGIIAGWAADSVTSRLSSGPTLALAIAIGGMSSLVIGLSSSAIIVWAMFATFIFFAVMWNVITVSLRQSVIPDELLGRVNSVYRMFAWGSIPVGALAGGLIIALAETGGLDRLTALRAPWIVTGLLHLPLLIYAAPKLTTAKIDAVRAEAVGDGTDTAEQ